MAHQIIMLKGQRSSKAYPERLRRVRYYDGQTHVEPALTITAIYKQRWQIQLVFKWLKQNLNVQHFFAKPISLRNFMHVDEANMLEKVTLTETLEAAVSLDNSEICLTQPQLF